MVELRLENGMAKATQEEIQQELLQFVAENILDKSMAIDCETPFREVGVDSFSIIQIVLFIERKYKLSMTEKDLIPENLHSIAAIASFTSKHL